MEQFHISTLDLTVIGAYLLFIIWWGLRNGKSDDSQSYFLAALPLILYKAMGELGVRWEILMAYSTVVVLPILVIFIIMQKYIVNGLTAGAVKG